MSSQKISKECLSLAAEFAVASELCRRGIYTQLTFGNKKRTDLLVFVDNKFLRIEVKAKQGNVWPNCKGIFGEDVFPVLVDYANRDLNQRPDFYILNSNDWQNLVKEKIKKYKEKHPDKKVEINSENVPVFLDETNKQGKPYKGLNIKPEIVSKHKEAWEKIETRIFEKKK